MWYFIWGVFTLIALICGAGGMIAFGAFMLVLPLLLGLVGLVLTSAVFMATDRG